LKSTRVEPSFRDASEEQKCLFDFVDEHGVQELYESIKQSMDRFDGYRQSLHHVFRAFEHDLDSLMKALQPVLPQLEENTEIKENLLVHDISPVPSLFTSLENHATEVASHLESLVKHYDLCLSALRNTEGGGEFISKASQEETPQLAGLGLGITNLEDDKPTETISEQDRLNILAIIMKDATEVDGVVDEIRDGLAEMEEHLSQIETYVIALRATSKRLQSTYGLLKAAMEKVPDYIAGCSEFQIAWEDEKRLLDTKMDEIEGLTEFYDEFSSGYDALIVEAHRRRYARKEMDKIAKQALSQIDKLHKGMSACSILHLLTSSAELKRRDEFRKSQGEYLPSDIWPGLMDEPVHFELAPVGDEATKLPELSRSVIEAAMERLSSRQHE
jgi:autophagy-related protein 17